MRLIRATAALLALTVGLAGIPAPGEAGNTTARTGKGAVADQSVYCQQWQGHSPYPEYPGTGPQTPCGPNFGPQPKRPPPLQGSVTYDEAEDGNWLRGAAKGFAACADGLLRFLGSTLVAAGQMLDGDFVGAERSLGLERGRGTILRTIMFEAQQNALNATPEEAGERVARRICQYVLIPQAARAARTGGTPFNPVRGTAVNASWKGLEGRWIELEDGGQVIQLGKLKGSGAYGAVYENAGAAGEVVKILNPAQDMAAAVTRQVQGFFNVLQTGRIPVPRITNYRLGSGSGPAFIVMEDVDRMFGGQRPRWFTSGDGMGAADLEATRQLHQALGEEGYLWADANPGNIFTVARPDGSTVAGIADADFIFRAEELPGQPPAVLKSVRILLDPLEPMADPWMPANDPVLGPLLRDPSRLNAASMMDEFFQTRRLFGDYGPPQ